MPKLAQLAVDLNSQPGQRVNLLREPAFQPGDRGEFFREFKARKIPQPGPALFGQTTAEQIIPVAPDRDRVSRHLRDWRPNRRPGNLRDALISKGPAVIL